MARTDGMLVFAAQYASLDDAKQDFEAIKIAHKEKFVGFYDAALFTKEEGGKVKIVDTDESGRARGTVIGLATGAVLGLIFPPSLLLWGAAGAGVGAAMGHMTTGMDRGALKDLGETLDEGEAGIVMVGETTIEEGMEKLTKRAAKVMKKQVDVSADELKKQIDEAAKA